MVQECRFIKNPTDDIVVEVDKMFSIGDGIISVGKEELKEMIGGVENVLLLSGKGTGQSRVSDAIEDAVLHTCNTAPGYNLFTADKVIVQLIYSEQHELQLEEIEGLTQFADMFPPSTRFLWGISKSKSMTSPNMIARIVAANIKLKS